jgi:hypothetical protein
MQKSAISEVLLLSFAMGRPTLQYRLLQCPLRVESRDVVRLPLSEADTISGIRLDIARVDSPTSPCPSHYLFRRAIERLNLPRQKPRHLTLVLTMADDTGLQWIHG